MASKFSLIAKKAFKKVQKVMGEPIIYHYNDGDSIQLCAVFYVSEAEVNVGGELSINSVNYEFSIFKCDIQVRPQHGDTITARNSTFEVVDVNDHGIVSYVLRCHSVDNRYTEEYDII